MKRLTTVAFILLAFTALTQNTMRPLEQLINTNEPGWNLVTAWIDSAGNTVEILPVDSIRAKDALHKTQVTTRSPMGAIVYMTGGMLIDHGWIRILGSGSEKMTRSLPYWNKGKAFSEFGEAPPFLLIADDAIGGFFLLNGGGLGDDPGKVYYFSPSSLALEPLDVTYTEFLLFCFNGDLDAFYAGYRWPTWKEDTQALQADRVFSFFPYLFTKEGKDISKNTRKEVPAEEHYFFNAGYQAEQNPGK